MPLESISSRFIDVKDERQEKLDYIVVNAFFMGAAAPSGCKHLDKTISRSGLAHRKPILWREVDTEIADIIKEHRLEQIRDLL